MLKNFFERPTVNYGIKQDGMNLWLSNIFPIEYTNNVAEMKQMPKLIANIVEKYLKLRQPYVSIHVTKMIGLITRIDSDFNIRRL